MAIPRLNKDGQWTGKNSIGLEAFRKILSANRPNSVQKEMRVFLFYQFFRPNFYRPVTMPNFAPSHFWRINCLKWIPWKKQIFFVLTTTRGRVLNGKENGLQKNHIATRLKKWRSNSTCRQEGDCFDKSCVKIYYSMSEFYCYFFVFFFFYHLLYMSVCQLVRVGICQIL